MRAANGHVCFTHIDSDLKYYILLSRDIRKHEHLYSNFQCWNVYVPVGCIDNSRNIPFQICICQCNVGFCMLVRCINKDSTSPHSPDSEVIVEETCVNHELWEWAVKNTHFYILVDLHSSWWETSICVGLPVLDLSQRIRWLETMCTDLMRQWGHSESVWNESALVWSGEDKHIVVYTPAGN